jgi:hypothetical protein
VARASNSPRQCIDQKDWRKAFRKYRNWGKQRSAVADQPDAYDDASALYGIVFNVAKGYPWQDRADAILTVLRWRMIPSHLWQKTLASGQREDMTGALDWVGEKSAKTSATVAETMQGAAVDAIMANRDSHSEAPYPSGCQATLNTLCMIRPSPNSSQRLCGKTPMEQRPGPKRLKMKRPRNRVRNCWMRSSNQTGR